MYTSCVMDGRACPSWSAIFAGTIGPELVALIEHKLSRAELKAANTAQATPGAGAFLEACRATGRTVAVVSNNSAAASLSISGGRAGPTSSTWWRAGDIEAGLAAEVWTIGYANKPGKDDAMRETGADLVIASMAELADVTQRMSV